MADKIGTQADLARMMDLKESTISSYKRKGFLDGCFLPDGRLNLTKAQAAIKNHVNPKAQAKTNERWEKAVEPEVAAYIDASLDEIRELPLPELVRLNELEKLLIQRIKRRDLEKEFIPFEKVDKKADAAGRQIRETLEGIGARLAPLVAAQADPWDCQKIIDDEINFICKNLSEILLVERED